ncbi:MAG: PD40 domain-containing protein [Chloroflexi bacterium]|nr:PD40 domain-containing protein [Chloroflexota bacterium]
MTLEKNTLLHNRYRIVEILGQGGMGSVYRAIDENLGVVIALKENLFTTDEYSRQFRLEAVILANLRHPNLPRVSDHIVLGDQGQYLVMDFIEGEDLRYRMERLGMLGEDDAIHIGAAICDALSYLHTRKPPILHRDIKPGNVKITPDGHIFLVDFGLAKVYQNASQATTTGARAMTPGYSPPEQYGTARTDPRTDVYSLGATLYAALSGVIPEDGLARAMDNAQLTPLRKRNSKVSRRLAAAIEKAMAVDPSDRFQDAEEFKKALLGAKSKTQQITGGYTVAPPPVDSFPKKDMTDSVASVEAKAPVPSTPPITIKENLPFVSPLKKQKERERKRRFALIRFTLILLVLLLASVPFFAPGILSANLRGMIPFLPPANTAVPTASPTALPTQTQTTAFTPTAIKPTSTIAPTKTALPSATSTLVASPADSATPLINPILAATPVGGGDGQLAYASSRSGNPQIYLVNLATESAIQITDMPEGACQPSWSPDGLRLVFISPCKGMDDIFYNTSLYIINGDGSGLTAISPDPGGDFDPAWSPDGKSIAFTSLRSGQREIYIVDVNDFSSVTQLTKNASRIESRQPAWSPDGSQIAYTVKRVGVDQIWLMNADGSDQRQIVRSGTDYRDYLPTWSPDGQTILFNQRCAVKFCSPYIMSISATDRTIEQGTRLGFNVVTIENIHYSPDGSLIAYEGGDSGDNNDIYYMTITGANRIRITTDPSLDFNPAWRPVPKTP